MTTTTDTNWQEIKIHFGKKAGATLGSLSARDLSWWKQNWFPNPRFAGAADVALRAALDVATIQEAPAACAGTGSHVGTVGEKITVTVMVIERFDLTAEFNRKKVVQEVAVLQTAEGAKLRWKTADIPSTVKVGEEITLTGTVKDHGEWKGEKVTGIKLVKVDGAAKIKATHGVTLFCDGKSSADRIAVTNCTTGVLYCGSAGLGRPSNGDNTDHELAGALKALEIANAARQAAGLDVLAVTLNYDARWMGGMVGKAKPIRDFAKANNLLVTMVHIAGNANPADEWTVGGGERRADFNLAELVKPL